MFKKWMPWAFALIICIAPAQASAKTVKLSWDPSPSAGVEKYTVFASLESDMSDPVFMIDSGLSLTETIYSLDDNKDYWFCVKAVDGSGNSSVCSNIVKSPKIFNVLPDLLFDVDVELIW